MKLSVLVLFLFLPFSFCLAQTSTIVSVNEKVNFVRPEDFGANAFDDKDDSPAINQAVAYAMRTEGITAINFGGGKYIIGSDINANYKGKGNLVRKGILFNGSNSTIFLKGGRFNILTDIVSQQDTKFSFKNFYFYTDNVSRPDGIYVEGACFVDISDCIFERCAVGIWIKSSGMNNINNCKFWGCMTGVRTYRVRDTYIDKCHAYACDYGFYFEGVNDSGSDGNITLSNSVANACNQSNITFNKVYAPVITGVTAEQCKNNLKVISTQFGTLANSFFGPAPNSDYGMEFVQNGMSNDFWTISNINTQDRIKFDGLRSSTITGLSGKLVRNTRQNHAFLFSNSAFLTLSGVNVREIDTQYSILFETSTEYITVGQFHLDKPVMLRGQTYSIKNGFIKGGIKTDSGKYGKLMNLEFTDDSIWKSVVVRNGLIMYF